MIFSLLCNTLFAKDNSKNKVKIVPIKTPYNEIQTTTDGKTQQTVVSDSGIEITLDAELSGDDIQYNLKLTNLRNKNFKVKQDCIKTYYGNFDKDSWTENDYTSYKLPEIPETQTPSTKTNKDDELSTLQTCLVAGATCLCALSLIQICSSSSSSDKVTYAKNAKTRRVEPRRSGSSGSSSSRHYSGGRSNTNFIWLFIDTPDSAPEYRSDRTEPDRNVTTTVIPDELPETQTLDTYKGSFLVPAGEGPDYKLRFIVSENEFIDFYFSRSDRENIVNPFKDRTFARNSLLVSTDLSFEKWGGYYVCSGNPIGFYIGATVSFPMDSSVNGVSYDGDLTDIYLYDNVIYPSSYNPNNSYRYSLANVSTTIFNTASIDLGLTIKLIPHTWLMAGCGFDVSRVYRQGEIRWKYASEPDTAYMDDSRYLQTGWIKQDELEYEVYPEIGVNIIFDHLDIGAMCQYSITRDEVSFKLMAGIAF